MECRGEGKTHKPSYFPPVMLLRDTVVLDLITIKYERVNMTTETTPKLTAGFSCEGSELLRAPSDLLWISWENIEASCDVVS